MPISKTETAARKDVQKLQRAIVDGLEDVKAQDIQVFNTEHLSPLFERVIMASGTSNRQTKALAASVRDAVRASGLATAPRTEGEENGEWIIVDCGAAVVHIMQPAIRAYYHLEEIWGDTPVRLKLGAAKPAAKKSTAARKFGVEQAGPAVAARKPGRGAGAVTAAADSVSDARKGARKSPDRAARSSGKSTAADAKAPVPRKRTAGRLAVSAAAPAAKPVKGVAAPIKKVVIKAAVRPPSRKKAGTAAAAKRTTAPARPARKS